MFCILNITETVFEEKFWNKVHEESAALIEKNKENNFYAFYKRGEPTFINASNEYDMLLKLHKNTKTFINEMPIYYEIMECDEWNDKRKKVFDTEEEMYKYYVEEILVILRIYDYHFEKLNIIQ